MSQEQYLKSPCAHCDGRISFPASARGMAVTCPHCGQQTVLNAAAAAPASAPAPAPAQPAPAPAAAPAAANPVVRLTATAKPATPKPLTEAQKAAIAAARAANPVSRPVVIKTQWADGADDVPASKPVRCDFCGSRVPAGATKCPDCDTPVTVRPTEAAKPSWFRRIGLVLVFILALVAAGRWGMYYLELRPKTGKDGKPLKEGVELLFHKLEAQPGTALSFVRGAVTNHSEVAWFDVKVECELLDKTGASLGKFSDSKIVLEPHKLFPFNISLLDPDARSYTNIAVTATR
jgi:DNA-directed RNA polymerase subunit RPC12/RpoP